MFRNTIVRLGTWILLLREGYYVAQWQKLKLWSCCPKRQSATRFGEGANGNESTCKQTSCLSGETAVGIFKGVFEHSGCYVLVHCCKASRDQELLSIKIICRQNPKRLDAFQNSLCSCCASGCKDSSVQQRFVWAWCALVSLRALPVTACVTFMTGAEATG